MECHNYYDTLYASQVTHSVDDTFLQIIIFHRLSEEQVAILEAPISTDEIVPVSKVTCF